MALLQAVTTVLSLTLAMVITARTGVFDTATVELGLEHYAERRTPHFPEWMPMPFNTIINFGYTVCGLSWILFIRKAHCAGVLKSDTAFVFHVFNSMGSVYGFIQLYRIVAQTRLSAIMDQWYTLPFFMLVYLWAQRTRGQCSWHMFYLSLLASVLSYSLVLLTTIGFEIALACHILLAVYGATVLYRQHPSEAMLQYFVLAVANCSGFVVLKVLDHHLSGLHWVFSYVSGHFLSKVCDVLQFHYVSKFFSAVILGVGADPIWKEKLKSL